MSDTNKEQVANLLSQCVRMVTCSYCKSYFTSAIRCTCGCACCAACWCGACASCGTMTMPARDRVATTLTGRVRALVDAFQSCFEYNMEEIVASVRLNTTNNVANWLIHSKNRFSPHIFDDNQTDWEKIEAMPDEAEKPLMGNRKRCNQSEIRKQWSNVKRMRKEFSKLGKINKNRLNVSINMCKEAPEYKHAGDIVTNKENDINRENCNNTLTEDGMNIDADVHIECQPQRVPFIMRGRMQPVSVGQSNNKQEHGDMHINCEREKVPFIVRGRMQPVSVEHNYNRKVHDKVANTNDDDLHITIRMGKIKTDIVINRKRQVQVTTTPHSLTTPQVKHDKNTESADTDTAQETPLVSNGAQETPLVSNGAQETPLVSNVAQESPLVSNVAQESPLVSNVAQETPLVSNGAQETLLVSNLAKETPLSISCIQETPSVGNVVEETPLASNGAQETPLASNGAQESPLPISCIQETPSVGNVVEETPLASNGAQETPLASNGAQESPLPISCIQETQEMLFVNNEAAETPLASNGAQESPLASNGAQESPLPISCIQETQEMLFVNNEAAETPLASNGGLLCENAESEQVEYDVLMPQVFAEIDADMERRSENIFTEKMSEAAAEGGDSDEVVEGTPLKQARSVCAPPQFVQGEIRHHSTPVAKQLATEGGEAAAADGAQMKAPTTATPICVAGSCLDARDAKLLKKECARRRWTFFAAYAPEVSHLIVAVDDDNKAQRTVKYMLALAAGKWILSQRWLRAVAVLPLHAPLPDESAFETLDWSGTEAPRLSRLSPGKLFAGFTFHCMPPFTQLDIDTLHSMIQLSGGRVLHDMAMLEQRAPTLVLAEPQDCATHEYSKLAWQHGAVPVNVDWLLNCIGSQALLSLAECVLCPQGLLDDVKDERVRRLLDD